MAFVQKNWAQITEITQTRLNRNRIKIATELKLSFIVAILFLNANVNSRYS